MSNRIVSWDTIRRDVDVSNTTLELPRFFGQVGYAARDPRAAMSSSC